MEDDDEKPEEKLPQLAAIFSLSEGGLVALCLSEDRVPGICTNDGCDFTTYLEPGRSEGYCKECRSNTVKSALILSGVRQ